jgi:hypothetical protein
MKRIAAVVLLVFPLLAVEPREPASLITHEWGTFTSIADENGSPVRWAPLSGPGDLPCFVANIGSPDFKLRMFGTVRMETPVLYFYSPHPVTLSVGVRFPQGWITEWYPNTSKVVPNSPIVNASYTNGEIRWDSVEVLPGHTPKLPGGKGPSHYYAARETDAAPLRVGSDWEKLIFYRGVGGFSIPLQPVFTPAGRLKIDNSGPDRIPLMILFENRGGKIGYRLVHGDTEVNLPELTANLNELRVELAGHLVEFGLYRKEALAMIETWRDSWFEEGMRLFYIVPRGMVDAVLPLDIKPAPTSIARVFVGRIELLSPGMRETIQSAAGSGDLTKLTSLGRFLGPFVTQMERSNPGRPRPAAIQTIFNRQPSPAGCVQ